MIKRPFVHLLFLLAVFFLPTSASFSQTRDVSDPLEAGSRAIKDLSGVSGEEAFRTFRNAVANAAELRGKREYSRKVMALIPGTPVPEASMAIAAELLRAYVAATYKEKMVKDLQEIVRFQTYAVEGRKNWDAPEFVRQRQWLRQRASDLGFDFRSYDGRVDEFTMSGGDSILAVLTHGDVQGVEGQVWTSPPWDAKIRDGKIIGRGVEDDKGPIIVTLYAMKALKDAGWPLTASLKLLIANGEESDWSEIQYYQERARMPSITLGIDASYPVTYAQKGFGVVTFEAGRGAPDSTRGKWEVVSISGGSGISIIPSQGEAILRTDGQPEEQLQELRKLAERWSGSHPPAKISVTPAGEFIKVVAEGKGGHSSDPSNGHNALGDVAAFLSTIDLKMNASGALISFVGRAVGTETDGKSLGIALNDELFGELTLNLGVFKHEGVSMRIMGSVRIVRGLSAEELDRRIQEKVSSFNKETGARVVVTFQQATGPHIADKALVSTLLSVWEEVMGQKGEAIVIGGGTQARLFKGGLDFGPGWPNQEYRGHSPDEYMTVDELMKISELTVTALWKLGCGTKQ